MGEVDCRFKSRNWLFITGGVLALLTIIFLYWEDFTFADKQIQYTDYRNSFYVAGLLVRQGRAADLYPRPQDKRFHDTAFNAYAHQMLPGIPPTEACNFLYPPLVAYLVAPLTFLPPRVSTFVWQMLSVCSLILAAWLFERTRGCRYTAAEMTASSFLVFPLIHVLLTGQLAVIFGLLPMVAGYYFVRYRRWFLAGLVWSIVSIKPQLFFPLACIIAARVINCWMKGTRGKVEGDYWKLIQGLCLGLIFVQFVPVGLAGPDAFWGWLRATVLVGKSVGMSEQTWAQHTVISLPAAISYLSPVSWHATARTISWLLSVAIGGYAVFWIARVDSSLKGREPVRLNVLIPLAFVFMPLAMPYVRFYDYAVWLFPLWVLFKRLPHNVFGTAARLAMVSVVLVLNGYWIFLWSQMHHPPAQVVLLPLFAIVLAALYLIGKSRCLLISR